MNTRALSLITGAALCFAILFTPTTAHAGWQCAVFGGDYCVDEAPPVEPPVGDDDDDVTDDDDGDTTGDDDITGDGDDDSTTTTTDDDDCEDCTTTVTTTTVKTCDEDDSTPIPPCEDCVCEDGVTPCQSIATLKSWKSQRQANLNNYVVALRAVKRYRQHIESGNDCSAFTFTDPEKAAIQRSMTATEMVGELVLVCLNRVEIAALTTRLDEYEQKLTDEIERIDGELDLLRAEDTRLAGLIADNTDDISDNRGNIRTNTTDIGTNRRETARAHARLDSFREVEPMFFLNVGYDGGLNSAFAMGPGAMLGLYPNNNAIGVYAIGYVSFIPGSQDVGTNVGGGVQFRKDFFRVGGGIGYGNLLDSESGGGKTAHYFGGRLDLGVRIADHIWVGGNVVLANARTNGGNRGFVFPLGLQVGGAF